MKASIWPELLIFACLALAACVAPAAAQNAPAPSAPAAQTTPVAPPMTEDDRLPFMQTEDAAAAAPGSGGLMMRALGAMALIVGLIFFAAWGLKKMGYAGFGADRTAEGPDLTVLSTISIASGRTISTVRFGEQVLLVGATAQSFTLLAATGGDEKSPAAEAAETERNPRSVAEMLAEEERARALAGFGAEFERAQRRLDAASDEEGKIA